jgi:predicted O-methyltransferase YrrM
VSDTHADLDASINAICAPEAEGGLPGWCTPLKGRWIAEHIQREHLTRCVEIGVFGGRCLLSMALAVRAIGRGGFVLGVDPYDFARQVESMDNAAHIEWAGGIPFENIYQGTLAAIRARELHTHCGLLRAAADECASIVGAIDLLHIDGCHSVLSSCRDVEVWGPKVRPGGLIVLDDCDWDTVQRARAMLAAMCEPNPVSPETGWECYRKV